MPHFKLFFAEFFSFSTVQIKSSVYRGHSKYDIFGVKYREVLSSTCVLENVCGIFNKIMT